MIIASEWIKNMKRDKGNKRKEISQNYYHIKFKMESRLIMVNIVKFKINLI